MMSVSKWRGQVAQEGAYLRRDACWTGGAGPTRMGGGRRALPRRLANVPSACRLSAPYSRCTIR